MSQTTSTPSSAASPPSGAPDALDRFFGWLRGLGIRRDSQDKWAAGVAAGVARRLGVDPVLVRVVFFVLALFGGFGITAYLLGWALLPSDRDDILAERAIRHGEGWPIVLLVVTALSLFGGGAWGHNGSAAWYGFGWIVPVGVIGWVIYRRSHGQSVLPRGGPTGTPTAPTPPAEGPGHVGWDGPTARFAAPSGAAYAGPSGADYAAPQAPVAPRPARATRPPRPRRRRPGSAITLLTIGSGVAAYGIGVLLDGPTGFPGSAHLLGSILALTVVALSVVTLGLAGRKSGFLGFVVIVLALVTALSAAAPAAVRGGVGDRTWTPSATTDYQLGLGQATLDLRNLPTSAPTPANIDVQVGLGELTIRVPKGVDAKVVTDLGAGDVSVDGHTVQTDTPNRSEQKAPFTWVSPGGSPIDVTVDVHLGAGSVHIEQGQ